MGDDHDRFAIAKTYKKSESQFIRSQQGVIVKEPLNSGLFYYKLYIVINSVVYVSLNNIYIIIVDNIVVFSV